MSFIYLNRLVHCILKFDKYHVHVQSKSVINTIPISSFNHTSLNNLCENAISFKRSFKSSIKFRNHTNLSFLNAMDYKHELLTYSEDTYNGAIIDMNSLPDEVNLFNIKMENSLNLWKENGKRGIWLKIPIEKSQLIHHAISNFEFIFHHAEKDYVMLTKWIALESECHLPPNASHQVGVGGFLLNKENKLLAVQEHRGPLGGKNIWKLPTGLVEAGEDISDAIIREIKEETGVNANFEAIVAIRQAHGSLFNKSDLFFVCVLSIDEKSENLNLFTSDAEIANVAWIDYDAFVNQDFFKQRIGYTKMLQRCWDYNFNKNLGLNAERFNYKNSRSELIMIINGDN